MESYKDLDKQGTARLIVDFLHRTAFHHGMWFAEVRHLLGAEKAHEILGEAYARSYGIQTKRMAKTLGFEMEGDIPKPLLDLSAEQLQDLLKNTAVNWLANDGVWFQAVEFSRNMVEAKLCNDTCWASFSPFEAWSIKRFLNLSDRPGLDGLKQALGFRLYSVVNTQSIVEEAENSFVFQMNECRVQSARKRKGLDDYPCKSAGLIEYPTFAEAVDARIRTECVGCPPDDHPEEWFCAWRFTLA